MNPEHKLRFGFVGCGEVAMDTANALQSVPDAIVTLVMDMQPELARSMGQHLQAADTTRLDDVLQSDEVDVVYIATPHHLHAPLVLQAAEAGKHIMVEKPLSTSVADGEQMIAACRRAGVRLSVCYILRYRPASQEAYRLVRAGAIGKVIGFSIREIIKKHASYWEGGYTGRAKTDWRQHWQTSGGGMLNINISHNLDCLRYVTGLEAVRVYAEFDTFSTPVEVEDAIAVLLRMDNGAIGAVQAASCVMGGSQIGGDAPYGDHIYGTAGTIIYSDRLWLAAANAEGRAEWREIDLTAAGAVTGNPFTDARSRYVAAFVEAVLRDQETPIPGEDGLAMVQIVQAAYESGRTHLPVAIAP